jgi:hypothetical protein
METRPTALWELPPSLLAPDPPSGPGVEEAEEPQAAAETDTANARQPQRTREVSVRLQTLMPD